MVYRAYGKRVRVFSRGYYNVLVLRTLQCCDHTNKYFENQWNVFTEGRKENLLIICFAPEWQSSAEKKFLRVIDVKYSVCETDLEIFF